jgi:hypothetical protein
MMTTSVLIFLLCAMSMSFVADQMDGALDITHSRRHRPLSCAIVHRRIVYFSVKRDPP